MANENTMNLSQEDGYVAAVSIEAADAKTLHRYMFDLYGELKRSGGESTGARVDARWRDDCAVGVLFITAPTAYGALSISRELFGATDTLSGMYPGVRLEAFSVEMLNKLVSRAS